MAQPECHYLQIKSVVNMLRFTDKKYACILKRIEPFCAVLEPMVLITEILFEIVPFIKISLQVDTRTAHVQTCHCRSSNQISTYLAQRQSKKIDNKYKGARFDVFTEVKISV
jgi:hypothetical protein